MKKKNTLIFGTVLSLFAVVGLSSCTQSFCSSVDTGRVMSAFDPGITVYEHNDSVTDKVVENGDYTYTISHMGTITPQFNDKTHKFYFTETQLENEYVKNCSYKELTYLNETITGAHGNGIVVPTSNQLDYFVKLDEVVLEESLKQALKDKKENITIDFSKEEDRAIFNRDMSFYSYIKFVENENSPVWKYWDYINEQVIQSFPENQRVEKGISTDYKNFYKNYMNSKASTYRTCLATKTDKYGSYGYSTDGIYVQEKTWSYAWQKGFFEGLLVYPIGWLIDQIAIGFNSLGAGPAALLSIFFVTLIIRGIMMAATFKQTKGNAKMTELQPEVTKIQNKYPNANTNKYEKQRMAEEINALYKKNKINPLSSLLMIIIQFPVFICVWGALSGASVLTTGSVLGLNLGTSIKDALFNSAGWTAAGNYSAVTALFLFLLMAGAQAVSMLLPQWMQKRKAKKVARLGKNPSQNSQDNKMKWVTYIMLAMIIFMGFSLVSAMGVYWLIGAVLSVAQTLIMQSVTEKKTKKR